MFYRHRNELTRPLLDFGCGDGSFASVLVKAIDYGIDIDSDAIAIARQTGAYGSLLQSQTGSIPIPDKSVRSILSNSVLEHVADLPTVMKELHRVLDVGGVLMAAVPVKQFERDLATYYGRKESLQNQLGLLPSQSSGSGGMAEHFWNVPGLR